MDIRMVMMVDPDGHWAYRLWVTTQLWIYDDRTAYANSRGVKAGIKGWAESYSFNFMGGGNFVNKLGSFITGASKGWKQSKIKCKVKASQVKVGNRKAMQSVLKSAGKQAIKAAIVRGSNKAVGVSSKVILNAVKTGEKVIQSGGRTKSTSKQAVVVLNKKGKVITTFAKGSK
ncbi:hypothetical protein BK750_24550 [Bacillus thuringiensis serovar jegathesan]|uniref:Wall-associated protein n=1 Tax=Bacillus thuringiensis subsp. jegathesan TaxID=56955 RepID=A0A9X6M390_BACTJ|nr:hypothetical protein [Bacillus thuringiensis]OUB60748.1 hypothetical protein BK750_24550 [Bacillus thuringiensis serovar jegathesan]